MKSWALVGLLVAAGFSILSQAQTSDRIATSLYSGEMVKLKGNVHSLAKPEFDLGRADSRRLIQGISFTFRPSPAQQQDLDNFLKELGDRSSPNYHKYLTPKQFGARFGLSQNDIDKATEWLSSHGFTNIKVAHNRNRISFDGSIGQIESAFAVEMRRYLVNGIVHLANAGEPSVPAGLGGSALYIEHLNDFAPRPHVKVKSHFTSYVSGNHFLSPGDFATIYDLQSLYSAGIDGTGQKIAVIGQSTVNTTDLSNFRSAAGLPASTVTMTLQGGTGTRCSGDEGESDLDLEWAGGVAKGAKIIFVYAGLNTGDTCNGGRVNSVWDALQYALDNNVAPFISTSYGFCESGLPSGFPQQVQSWVQQGQTQGQTVTAASGDAGAADCDTNYPASQGLAVDVPASIPEVTGAGGNEFTGDTAGVVSGNRAAADPPYWGASGAGSDTVSSAQQYIPEIAWNDSVSDSALSASGGGASTLFSKPSWQTGTGVPNDGWRDVPDVSVSASADHDGYLVCSEDNDPTSCAVGFRDGAGGTFSVVGGTSAAAPTISAIFALINQYLGNVPPTGLAPINPTLYSLYPNNSTTLAFNDITTGDNIIACTKGTTGCPSTAPFQYGFSAGTGYDQVTGLGSINGMSFAKAWDATRTSTTTTIQASASSANQGASVTFTATVSPATSGVVNFFNNGSSTPLGQATLSNGTAKFSTTSLPVGANSVTAGFAGNTKNGSSTSGAPAEVSVSTASFTLTPSVTTLTVAQGQTTGPEQIVVTSSDGFIVGTGSSAQTLMPVTYTCSGLPSEANCLFNAASSSGTGSITTSATSVTLTISTTAPTAKLLRLLNRGQSIFYAVLFPGLLGIVATIGSRKRSLGVFSILALIVLLSLSALWMSSCGGGSSTPKDPGTPSGNSNIVVNATTGGSNPITGSVKFTLTVTP
jgi:subtilase family serine protease